MGVFFAFVIFASLVCLILGLNSPTVFSYILKAAVPTRKQVVFIFGGAMVVFFVFFLVINHSWKKDLAQTMRTASPRGEGNTVERKPLPELVEQDKFILAGSGSNLPVTGKLAESYSTTTGQKIEVLSSIGSDGAINAVASGKLELGLISRHLAPSERELGLKEVPYARVAVVFGAHRDVLDGGVSAADVLGILNGSKTSWSNGCKIYTFIREKSDSSNLVLYEKIPGFKDALLDSYYDHRWEIMYRDCDMTDALKKTKGSFGVVNSTDIAATDYIKALNFNGVLPTTANVLSGEYKLVKDLSFVYKNQLSSRSADFIDFVFSAEGQDIMTKYGAVPLGR